MSVIPRPVRIDRTKGRFSLRNRTPILLPKTSDTKWTRVAEVFVKKAASTHGIDLEAATPGTEVSHNGVFVVEEQAPELDAAYASSPDDFARNEAYEIDVGENVTIRAAHPHGLHNAFATLLQMVDDEKTVPAAHILDYPRFRHRGLLLDSARSFLPADVIKRYIDIISELKLNVLHLHLVDDQGWRIESGMFPKLHEVGGVVSNLSTKKLKALASVKYDENGRRSEEPRYFSIDEASRSRGYYTRDELKDIVDFAAERHVEIIPEIDVPGHSSALLAAYPELSCSGKPVRVKRWPGIYGNALCPGKEEVYEFLDKLFGELREIFPSEYVHIGSDEVKNKTWMSSPHNRRLVEKYDYKDNAGLQSYFVGRVGEILERHGKTMIAWDEVTGYAPEGSIVQAWRRHSYAKKAAEAERDAIVSPVSHCYLDYPQLFFSHKRLYGFEPVPKGLDASLRRHIIGGEVNLWGEFVTLENTDSKLFPRLLSHAEVMWSPARTRNWNNFAKRLKHIVKRMEAKGVRFGGRR